MELTQLEKGIVVWIEPKEFEKLQNKSGFLSWEAYPDEYKKIALTNEIGRFLNFRFLLKT